MEIILYALVIKNNEKKKKSSLLIITLTFIIFKTLHSIIAIKNINYIYIES